MYPANTYFEKQPPSPTFVNITTPYDHHHHHHYPSSPTAVGHPPFPIHSPSMKFSKTKGLVTSAPMIPDQTELIFPEDSYSIEFCMPDNVICKCPPPAADVYREKRRKHKSSSESGKSNGLDHRWTKKSASPMIGPYTDDIDKIENYCTPPAKHQQPPMYDVYSYAYLEPPPPQPPSASSSSQSQSGSSTGSTASSSSRSFNCNTYGGPSRHDIPGPSKAPSRSSIKALLAKSFRSKNIVTSTNTINCRPSTSGTKNGKYTYTTRYGTTENLYEEVNDEKIKEILGNEKENTHSTFRPQHVTAKEEQRRVQTNHFRILDELNLSLEALIMPPTPPDVSPSSPNPGKSQDSILQSSRSVENLSSTLASMELKDDGDLDSGFSVSSNGTTCYNGSLRGSTRPENSQSRTMGKKCKGLKLEEHGIAMTLISPSTPFKSMKKYFESSNAEKQKSSSDDGDTASAGGKSKNKFWTIRQ